MKEQLSKLDTANLTIREIAQKLGKSVASVRSYLDRYKVPYLKTFNRQTRVFAKPDTKMFTWELFFDDLMFLP